MALPGRSASRPYVFLLERLYTVLEENSKSDNGNRIQIIWYSNGKKNHVQGRVMSYQLKPI